MQAGKGPVARRHGVLLGSGLLFVAVAVVALGVGPAPLSPWEVLRVLWRAVTGGMEGLDAVTRAVVLEIRLPRVVLGLLVGAGLSLAGAVMQGMFRNPLADPGLIGVSGGAAFGAVLSIWLADVCLSTKGIHLGHYQLPLFGFFGGLLATLLVYRLGAVGGRVFMATMLLAGIAMNALTGALMGYVIYVADDNQLRTITFWTMGSLGGATWKTVMLVAPIILIPLGVLPFFAKALNAMLLGEAEAGHLGYDTERTKKWCIVLGAAVVGAAVSVSGMIGFVGLVIPHIIRLMAGPDNRGVLIGSVFLGGGLLVLADLFARTIVAPAELPLGLVTATVGAPFFIWLLLRSRKKAGF